MENKEAMVVDERVSQETTRIMAQNFWTGVIVLLVLLAIKVVQAVTGGAWIAVLPESVTLVTGVVSLLVQRTRRGLWGPKDERTAAESVEVLHNAWRHMVAVLCACILVMILMGVDKDTYQVTILFNVVVVSLQERRLVKAGVFHQQGGNITKKGAVKMILSVGVFGVAAVAFGSLLQGEMAPWWVFVLSPVLFMIIGAITAGVTWVQEIVSEQNADEAVKAAEKQVDGDDKA